MWSVDDKQNIQKWTRWKVVHTRQLAIRAPGWSNLPHNNPLPCLTYCSLYSYALCIYTTTKVGTVQESFIYWDVEYSDSRECMLGTHTSVWVAANRRVLLVGDMGRVRLGIGWCKWEGTFCLEKEDIATQHNELRKQTFLLPVCRCVNINK